MTTNDPAFGLFTVDCECGTIFHVEDITCPACNKIKGTLKLNISEFLDRVYQLSDQNQDDRALDVIFDIFWNLHDKFDVMSDILGQVDMSRLNEILMVGFMVQTFKYAKQVPNHNLFCKKCEVHMRELGVDDENIHDLINPYLADPEKF